jgi:N6-L-threonylcarbamoyladenine synthase
MSRTGRQTREWKNFFDAIAVTCGPGLVTSLLVGTELARTLSYLWEKPLVAVNHLEGHIYANWLPPIGELKVKSEKLKAFRFPILCLIVSGGHTELVLMKKHLDYTVIGATRDDAAGECFDKVAKILKLGYPGGPIISKLAHKGNPRAVELPRPMLNSKDFDFSFAGLKTAVLYKVQSNKKLASQKYIKDLAASFEQAAVDVLVAKTVRAANKYKAETVLLGGGVAANQRLREQLVAVIKKQLPAIQCSLPNINYTTDNAAMIATAGYFHVLKKDFTLWQKLEVDPNLELK